jgi:capsid assembly protease
MKSSLLLAEALRTAWAIEPKAGQMMIDVLTRHARGEIAPEHALEAAKAARDERATRRQPAIKGRGIMVLPLCGVIVPKANLITEYSGGTSCQLFSAALRDALADEAVAQILIDIDSPGGSVAGVQELASEIMQARTQKPVLGIANYQAASAAYWLGACCNELYVSPSGEVGSIGVWTAHQDVSQAMENEGVKTTLISAGKYKTEGNPFSPLDNEAKDFIQDSVNSYYRSFVAAVARGRGVSVDKARNGMGQGRMLTAEAAKAEGMVDGITTIGALVGDMQARPRSSKGLRAVGANAGAFGFDRTAAERRAAARRREIDLLELL